MQQNLHDDNEDPFQDQRDTPQEEQYEDASQQQPIIQDDPITHEQ